MEMDDGGRSPFLTLRMFEGDEALTARLDYNADLFEAATIARMLRNFRTLLESVVADPERRLSELPPLTEAERPTAGGVAADARRRAGPARAVGAGGWPSRLRKRLRRAVRGARRAVSRRLGVSLGRADGRRGP
jgi:non-ribosomal peptide synthetase component F